MIARCRAKCWVVHLKEDNSNLQLPYSQRGVKGHIIIYPQNPSAIVQVLPPSLEEVVTLICVLFVGSSPPTQEWLRTKASPLIVRRERVRDALRWLSLHNRLYKDVRIDHDSLDKLETEQLLPVHVQCIPLDNGEQSLTSRYDAADLYGQDTTEDREGGYVQIPHGSDPVNEFCNPDLFPMIYPTLFPYGLGGFEFSGRKSKISMQTHKQSMWLLNVWRMGTRRLLRMLKSVKRFD
ncbi:hypothetical protein P692DRAFT_20851727 [Suillus brevipes Sb2]|nr:hypothetical protein P692DRAFT_20851727 [Suillus brevipes Sb2]